MSTALIGLACLSAVLAIAADWRRRGPAFYLFKPLTTVLIIGLCLAWPEPADATYRGSILLGLVFCLAGDVFLMGNNNRAFIFGLVSFLIGHLIFMLAFLHGLSEPMLPLWNFGLLLWGLPLGAILLPRAGSLMWPVVVYAAVLMGMAITAAIRFEALGGLSGPSGPMLALLGALLFVLSDSLLGIRKFVQPRVDLQPALLLSYWAAIGLIAVSA